MDIAEGGMGGAGIDDCAIERSGRGSKVLRSDACDNAP